MAKNTGRKGLSLIDKEKRQRIKAHKQLLKLNKSIERQNKAEQRRFEKKVKIEAKKLRNIQRKRLGKKPLV